jgi:putative chitinase
VGQEAGEGGGAVTPELIAACTGARIDRASRFAAPLSAGMAFYGIDTPARQAAFLAQIGHESGGLKYTSEVWGPTAAQARYEGRKDLGNTQPGDGSRFRGHGVIQTTGRLNHRLVTQRLRARFDGVPDFEADPIALTETQWAALSACDYWDMRKLNELADSGDFEELSARINGRNRATGLPNGYEDRLERWEFAKRALGISTT